MTTLTELEILEIKERLAKATRGPWRTGHFCREDHTCECKYIFGNDGRFGAVGQVYVSPENSSIEEGDNPPPEEAKANQIFIASSHTDIARLLETVEAQQAEIERLRAALEPFKASFKHIMSVERGPTHVNLPLSVTQSMLCIGDLLNAAAALEKKEPDPKTGQVS